MVTVIKGENVIDHVGGGRIAHVRVNDDALVSGRTYLWPNGFEVRWHRESLGKYRYDEVTRGLILDDGQLYIFVDRSTG